MSNELIDHIVQTITPASRAQALGVEHRLAKQGGKQLGVLHDLATRLAAARHAPQPGVADKVITICAADHGVADPGIDLGSDSPAFAAIRHIADGKAAVCTLANSASARVILVDCGVRGGDRHALGAGVIDLRMSDGSADIRKGSALSLDAASKAVQTGVALCYSLADDGLDVLALGNVAPGGYPVSAAIVATMTEATAHDLDDGDDAIAMALAANLVDAERPLDVLATLGGSDIGILTGLILGAASINVPIVLDSHATSAAALIAVALAPNVAGYLIASHGGGNPAHRVALETLGLSAVFDLGLAHGEGAGAAMILPFLDSAAQLCRD